MHKQTIIWSILSVVFCSASFAQTQLKFDTTFPNTSSVKYFKDNPSISKVEFFQRTTKIKSLQVFLKTAWFANGFENYAKQKRYESFNLSFLGDVYILNKKYGLIEMPEKEIGIISKKTCGLYYYINGFITQDSIRLELSYLCEKRPTDPDEKIFEKVEIGVGYTGGIKRLKQQLENAITLQNIRLSEKTEDSVLIFESVLSNKDSSLKTIELIEGNYSAFSQTMMEALIKSGPWLPPLQGGRTVKAYFKIFIRLHKDNSITVAIPED